MQRAARRPVGWRISPPGRKVRQQKPPYCRCPCPVLAPACPTTDARRFQDRKRQYLGGALVECYPCSDRYRLGSLRLPEPLPPRRAPALPQGLGCRSSA
eukprot:scaffold3011_cov32-Tisochrysis_lutea.AAC.2